MQELGCDGVAALELSVRMRCGAKKLLGFGFVDKSAVRRKKRKLLFLGR